MIEVLTCPNCGLQFESNGPGTRCPVCKTRGTSQEQQKAVPDHAQKAGAAYFYSTNGGLRGVTWGGGKGLVLAIVSGVFTPFLFTMGIIAAAFGAIFAVSALPHHRLRADDHRGMISGSSSGSSGAASEAQNGHGRTSPARAGYTRRDDDDRVSGRWERTGTP